MVCNVICGRGLEMKYYECKVRDVKKVTHDTKLLLVEYPALMYVSVPVGHHVYIRHTVEGKYLDEN